MVDLVKLRKKAKAKKEEPSVATPAPEPASGLKPAATQNPAASETSVATGFSPSAPPSKLERFLESAGEWQGSLTTQQTGPAADEVELLTFVIAGEMYAVDIENIAEIVTPRRVTRVPNADKSIVGIFSLRGTIVTLIDVRSRLGHPRKQDASADSRVVVTRLGNDSVGFIVDRVQRVVNVPRAAIEPQPVVHTSEQDESVRGVFRHAGALTILLDLEKLLGAGDERPVAAKSR